MTAFWSVFKAQKRGKHGQLASMRVIFWPTWGKKLYELVKTSFFRNSLFLNSFFGQFEEKTLWTSQNVIFLPLEPLTGVWPVICRFQFRPHFHPLNLLFLPSYHSSVPRFKLKFNPSTLSSWLGHAFLKKMGGHFRQIWQKVSKCPLKCRFEISP